MNDIPIPQVLISILKEKPDFLGDIFTAQNMMDLTIPGPSVPGMVFTGKSEEELVAEGYEPISSDTRLMWQQQSSRHMKQKAVTVACLHIMRL